MFYLFMGIVSVLINYPLSLTTPGLCLSGAETSDRRREAAGRVEGRPGHAKNAGILLHWAAQASCSHRSGGTRRATRDVLP